MFQLNITEEDTSLEQALAYYDEGYNVVPLQRSNKKPPPFLKGWEQYKEERPSRTLVESWVIMSYLYKDLIKNHHLF